MTKYAYTVTATYEDGEVAVNTNDVEVAIAAFKSVPCAIASATTSLGA